MRLLILALLVTASATLVGQSPCSAGYCAGACTDFCIGQGCFCLKNGPNALGRCVGYNELEASLVP